METFMRKWILLPASLMLLAFSNSSESEGSCEGYMAIEKGVVYTYENYDQKNKLTGSTESSITELNEVEGVLNATVHGVHKDSKGKIEHEQDVNFSCENGEIKIDMQSMMNPDMMEGFKDAQITIDQTNLTVPAVLTEGQSLPDGKMTVKIDMSGFEMNMTIDVIDRKVEKFETIETPAGSFKCAKMSQKMITDMGMMKTTVKSIDWYALGVGAVKTESYNEKDELVGYTVLSKVTKP